MEPTSITAVAPNPWKAKMTYFMEHRTAVRLFLNIITPSGPLNMHGTVEEVEEDVFAFKVNEKRGPAVEGENWRQAWIPYQAAVLAIELCELDTISPIVGIPR